MPWKQLGRKGLFGLYFYIVVHHWRKQVRELKESMNLETGADAEAMEGLLHIGFLHVALSDCFSVQPSTAVLPPQGAMLSHISH